MLIVKNLTYKINFSDTIFENISFTLKENEKVSIIGKNGIGKSVLLQLIVGQLKQYSGEIIQKGLNIAYFPQKFNELNFKTIADVFGLQNQVIALNRIENNEADIEDYSYIDGNWDCIDIIKEKMELFNLQFSPLREFNTLSGGEKVKIILSSLIDKSSNFLILDEPTNNMDYTSKKIFYDFIKSWKGGVLLVSHDRELLNLMDRTIEMRRIGMAKTELFNYGGNFTYWEQQKAFEEKALENSYNNSIKKLENQKEQIQKNIKLTAEKKKQGERGVAKRKYDPTGFGLKLSQVQASQGKVINSYNRNLEKTNDRIGDIKEKLEKKENIYFKFSKNKFPNKNIITIENLHFFYGKKQIFSDFNMLVNTGNRIAIEGKNGSGKTTLFNIIMDKIKDYRGLVKINASPMVYLDQNCDFLDRTKTILDNIKLSNAELKEKDCRDILAQFLFRTDDVFKQICSLSGGEKLRVALACVFAKKELPELILLDEPTNNLDLDSIKILENILKDYMGTIIITSHDKTFKENININKTIELY